MLSRTSVIINKWFLTRLTILLLFSNHVLVYYIGQLHVIYIQNKISTVFCFQDMYTSIKMLEVWAPISYNYFSNNLKAGLGARLAYLYFGTDDLLSLASGNAKSVNFYIGFRIAGNFSKNKVRKAE